MKIQKSQLDLLIDLATKSLYASTNALAALTEMAELVKLFAEYADQNADREHQLKVNYEAAKAKRIKVKSELDSDEDFTALFRLGKFSKEPPTAEPQATEPEPEPTNDSRHTPKFLKKQSELKTYITLCAVELEHQPSYQELTDWINSRIPEYKEKPADYVFWNNAVRRYDLRPLIRRTK